MKCVIFICLLSLSMCFSNPITEGAAAAKNDKTQTQSVPDQTQPTVPTQPTDKSATPTNNTPKLDPPKETKDAPTLAPTAHTESTAKPDTTTKPAGKSDKEKEATTTTVAPNNNAQPITVSTEKAAPVTTTAASNTPAPDSDDKNKSKTTVTTPKAEVITSTEAPKEDKLLNARAFDGPSFIGGIILTLGLLAIGFMGFKYYKNQTERNYHTL